LTKNGNSSTKYGNNLTYLKNIKERINDKSNRNNMSFKKKKLMHENINSDFFSFNNTLSLSMEKNKAKSKNNISIIKSRKDIFPNSVIKTKYKHKNSVNKYNNKYMKFSSNSKSPYRINKSSVDIISSEYDHILTHNINHTYNHNNDPNTPNCKNHFISSFQNKDSKPVNGYNKRKITLNINKIMPNNKRDNQSITSNINNYKNKVIYKNTFENSNFNFHSSFNESDQIQSLYNNPTFLNKNKLDNSFNERKKTINGNHYLRDYALFEPFPLNNVYVTNKYTIKTQIEDILEEMNIKFKKIGFTYIINNDTNDGNLIKISIRSYYNPSVNIIQYYTAGEDNYSSFINKIDSKIKKNLIFNSY
jgi:hypothetical protein